MRDWGGKTDVGWSGWEKHKDTALRVEKRRGEAVYDTI